MNLLSILIFILIAGYSLERFLDFLNAKNWSDKLPASLQHIIKAEEYKKSQQYDKANKKLNLVSETMSLLLMVGILLGGFFGKLDDWTVAITNTPMQATLLFFGIIATVAEIIGLPFTLYRTFVIEEKFGFNKVTPALFISDKIKGCILGIIILGSLLALFSLIYTTFREQFWIYTWIVASLVMVIMSMFYTSWFLPIFNKLTPLEEGSLRDAIEAYCSKTGFKISNILVMDGSKRSAKSNAFFSGFGPKKNIVLFDTLIEKHTTSELVAILAHETGHYRLKHIRSGMLLSIFQTGVLLYLFSLFMNSNEISVAMGGSHHTIELGILAFGILYTPISIAVGMLVNYLSRKHEFEADHYAATTYDGNALQEALKKLSVNNLSNLNPHNWYIFFYYSHPPLLQRLSALDKGNQIA